jgi:hypothetical protein
VTPHDIVSLTNSELVNESILMVICYHFILFTGVVSDVVTRTNLGWSLSAFVGVLLIYNVYVILLVNLTMLTRKFTLWSIGQKSKKAIEIKRKLIDDERKLKQQTQNKVIQNRKMTSPAQK